MVEQPKVNQKYNTNIVPQPGSSSASDNHYASAREAPKTLPAASMDGPFKRPGMPPSEQSSKKPRTVSTTRYTYLFIMMLLYFLPSVQSTITRIKGYDCQVTTHHELVPSPCMKQVVGKYSDRYDGLVAYLTTDSIVTGYRCTANVYLQSYYCGTSSHVHILDVPQYEKISLKPAECYNIYKTGKIEIYGKLYSVKPDSGINQHGLMVNGSLSYGSSIGGYYDVFCNPNGVNAGNHFVDYGFQVGTLSVSATKIPLLVTPEEIIDHQLQTVIGHYSNCTRGCTAATGSYYIPGYHTKYRLVKSLSFQKYKQGNQVFIVNHTENIHMEIIRMTTNRLGNRQEQIWETELPDLVIFIKPELKGLLPVLHQQEARYDIASWINTLYRYKQLQTTIEQQVQYETCVRTHQMRFLPTTHYTIGKSITSLGELMRVSTCKPVNVTITEGRNDNCYHNHLTVQVDNVTKVMLPGSRIVFDVTNLKPTSCANHPVFIYIGNNSYFGNKGSGMERLTVTPEVGHPKSHIFWSPLDSAIHDLTIMGENRKQDKQVTYLSDLKGTPSIAQTTATQVEGLEALLNWTFGKGFTKKFKSYIYSIIMVLVLTSLGVYLACILLKITCRKIYTCKFLPVRERQTEIEMN